MRGDAPDWEGVLADAYVSAENSSRRQREANPAVRQRCEPVLEHVLVPVKLKAQIVTVTSNITSAADGRHDAQGHWLRRIALLNEGDQGGEDEWAESGSPDFRSRRRPDSQAPAGAGQRLVVRLDGL